MIPALSQICSLNSPFEADVEEYAAGQCTAVEAWLTKLETFCTQHSVARAREILQQHGVAMPVASLQGGLLSSQGAARQQAWELFRRRLELLQGIGAETIVVACDVRGTLQQQDIDRVSTSLTQLAEEAGRRQLRVALEFQADATFGNNLQTAAALVGEVGSPHLGLCFDLFHYATGPSKPSDLGYLNQSNLFHVQVCDLADIPREFARDGDRILPGDGDLEIELIVQRLREIDYQGLVAIETMNPQLWEVPARQFGEIAMTALRKILGQAGMQ